eukprot:TRINITY_DN4697_c0_g1_i1.p1 TRINITY_DN4697_c0_g1~~TRINITY_DN4697_c0_g1_i1.p1  ORF type:complete len:627 (-),score=136.10 TRINITY_DN4697_c0_g1_i1:30-1706(-)
MNNSAFSSDPKGWDKKAIRRLRPAWKSSMGATKRLVKTLTEMKTINTTAFTDMKNLRFLIKEKLHKARLEIMGLQDIQREIEAAEKALNRYQADEQAFQNYTRHNTIKKTELQDCSYHNTICGYCTFVCHNRCGLDEITSDGSNSFKNCGAMNGDNCRYCPGQCSYTQHYHRRQTVVEIEQTLEEVLEDVKAKYDEAQEGSNQTSKKINTIKSTKDMIDRSIIQLEKDISIECQKLKKICSGFNLVEELANLVEQLKLDSKTLTSLDARSSSERFIRAISYICNSMKPTQASSAKRTNTTFVEDVSSDDDDPEFEEDNPQSHSSRGQNNRTSGHQESSFRQEGHNARASGPQENFSHQGSHNARASNHQESSPDPVPMEEETAWEKRKNQHSKNQKARDSDNQQNRSPNSFEAHQQQSNQNPQIGFPLSTAPPRISQPTPSFAPNFAIEVIDPNKRLEPPKPAPSPKNNPGTNPNNDVLLIHCYVNGSAEGVVGLDQNIPLPQARTEIQDQIGLCFNNFCQIGANGKAIKISAVVEAMKKVSDILMKADSEFQIHLTV